MSRTREYTSNAERQRAYRERKHEIDGMRAHAERKVLVGRSTYIAARGEWRGIPWCVRFAPDGTPVEILFTRTWNHALQPIERTHTNDAYADGVGRCHDGAHESSDVHACEHDEGTHVRRTVGTYTPRDRVTGADTIATRRYADIDARHRADQVGTYDRKCERGAHKGNTYRAERPPMRRIRPWTRERDALLWAREYAGVIA